MPQAGSRRRPSDEHLAPLARGFPPPRARPRRRHVPTDHARRAGGRGRAALPRSRRDRGGAGGGRAAASRRRPPQGHARSTTAASARLSVVCGAPNVTAGKKYPFARVGATVPHGKGGAPMKLEKAKLRGEVSEGMLCSARELGLGQEHDGILELATDAAPGTPFLRRHADRRLPARRGRDAEPSRPARPQGRRARAVGVVRHAVPAAA